jgi:hypothetical protein
MSDSKVGSDLARAIDSITVSRYKPWVRTIVGFIIGFSIGFVITYFVLHLL